MSFYMLAGRQLAEVLVDVQLRIKRLHIARRRRYVDAENAFN